MRWSESSISSSKRSSGRLADLSRVRAGRTSGQLRSRAGVCLPRAVVAGSDLFPRSAVARLHWFPRYVGGRAVADGDGSRAGGEPTADALGDGCNR